MSMSCMHFTFWLGYHNLWTKFVRRKMCWQHNIMFNTQNIRKISGYVINVPYFQELPFLYPKPALTQTQHSISRYILGWFVFPKIKRFGAKPTIHTQLGNPKSTFPCQNLNLPVATVTLTTKHLKLGKACLFHSWRLKTPSHPNLFEAASHCLTSAYLLLDPG